MPQRRQETEDEEEGEGNKGEREGTFVLGTKDDCLLLERRQMWS